MSYREGDGLTELSLRFCGHWFEGVGCWSRQWEYDVENPTRLAVVLYDNDLLYEGCLARVQSSLEGFRDLSFHLNLLHFNGQRMTYKLTTLVQIFDPGKRKMRTSELAPNQIYWQAKMRFLYYLPGGNIMYYLPGGKFQSWAPQSGRRGHRRDERTVSWSGNTIMTMQFHWNALTINGLVFVKLSWGCSV